MLYLSPEMKIRLLHRITHTPRIFKYILIVVVLVRSSSSSFLKYMVYMTNLLIYSVSLMVDVTILYTILYYSQCEGV